jgi:hypothetical protein
VEPWFMLTYGASMIGNVLTPAGYPAHIVNAVPSGGVVFRNGFLSDYSATITEGLAIMLGHFAATEVLGLALFERKEFS